MSDAYTITEIRNDLGACSGRGAKGWRTVLEVQGKPADYRWTPLAALDAGVSIPDVTWFLKRIDPAKTRRFALSCAIFALPIFEARHPDDMRPRRCIETTARYLRGDAEFDELQTAAEAVMVSWSECSARDSRDSRDAWAAWAAWAAWTVARAFPYGAAAAESALLAGVPFDTVANHLRAMLTDSADIPPMPTHPNMEAAHG